MSYFELCKGTVEDTSDPKQQARVRVRLDGYHTQLGDYGYSIAIEELDWYPVLMPTTSSSRNGKGASPSGLLVGDRVLVYILDEFIQSVLVVGTIHGDGDTSDLSHGGLDGLMSDSVETTNSSLTRAPILDRREYVRDLIENDDVGYQAFIDALVFDEGFRSQPYYDSLGYPTIGIGTLLVHKHRFPLSQTWSIVERKLGRKIPERRITKDEAMRMAESDINRMISEIPRFSLLNTAYNKVSQTRKYGLLSMCYQMGVAGVAKFNQTLNYIIAEEWEKAYKSMLQSKWARQTPQRASRVASIIRDNNFGQYPMNLRGGVGARTKYRMFNVATDHIFDLVKPLNNGSAISFPDLTELQLQIIEKTKAVRNIMNFRSFEDIKSSVKILMDYDSFIESVKTAFSNIQDSAKTLRDFKILAFVQKYIERFKDIIRKMVDDAVKYVQKVASDLQEQINLVIQGIKIFVERIIDKFNNIGMEIDDFVGRVKEFFSEKEDDNKESGIMFTEPPSEYAGEYPYVKTEISDSGHIREIDDTPGFERIKERHRTGTYREINSDGRLVQKVVSDNYLFVKGSDHWNIEGDGLISVGGSMRIHITGNAEVVVYGDCNQLVRGDLNAEVDGNTKILSIGNIETETRGNATHYTKGNVKLITDGNVDALIKGTLTGTIEGTTTLNLKQDVKIDSEANVNMTVKGNLSTVVDGNSDTHVKGTINLNGDGTVNIGGSRINFTRR